MSTKREQFRKRIATTLELLEMREKTRERYGQKDDPDFDEADYSTPCFIYNVCVHCDPLNVMEIETMRKTGKSLDDIMVKLYDEQGQPEPTIKISEFVPYN